MHPNKCLFGVGHGLGAIGVLYSVVILSQSFYNLFLGETFHQLNIVMFLFISVFMLIYVLCNLCLILGIKKVSLRNTIIILKKYLN